MEKKWNGAEMQRWKDGVQCDLDGGRFHRRELCVTVDPLHRGYDGAPRHQRRWRTGQLAILCFFSVTSFSDDSSIARVEKFAVTKVWRWWCISALSNCYMEWSLIVRVELLGLVSDSFSSLIIGKYLGHGLMVLVGSGWVVGMVRFVVQAGRNKGLNRLGWVVVCGCCCLVGGWV